MKPRNEFYNKYWFNRYHIRQDLEAFLKQWEKDHPRQRSVDRPIWKALKQMIWMYPNTILELSVDQIGSTPKKMTSEGTKEKITPEEAHRELWILALIQRPNLLLEANQELLLELVSRKPYFARIFRDISTVRVAYISRGIHDRLLDKWPLTAERRALLLAANPSCEKFLP